MARKGKLADRKKANKIAATKRPTRVKKYKQFFLIVCEDEKTEPYYFDQFKKEFPKRTLYLEPVGTGRDPLGVVEHALKLRKEYLEIEQKEIDFVWAVFDVDDAAHDKKKKERFEQALEIANRENISIAPSNEVFELWLLLHFIAVPPHKAIPRADIYKQLENEIQKLPAYTSFVYRHGKTDIIDILFDQGVEAEAIKRAKKLKKYHQPSSRYILDSNPKTEVDTLVSELREWIKYYNL